MIDYDPTSPLVSLHIPKTAGTSLNQVLASWFPDGRLLRHYGDGAAQPGVHRLEGPVCIHGHFNGARGKGAWQYYPQAMQYMAFFREPFDRFLSQWYYLTTHGGQHRDMTDFETWIHRRAEAQAEGRNDFSFIWHMPRPPGSMPVDTMLDTHFVFIGITEQISASVEALAGILGKPVVHIPHANQGSAERRSAEFLHWRSFYENHFADEYELYEKALTRNKILISQPPSLSRPTGRIRTALEAGDCLSGDLAPNLKGHQQPPIL